LIVSDDRSTAWNGDGDLGRSAALKGFENHIERRVSPRFCFCPDMERGRGRACPCPASESCPASYVKPGRDKPCPYNLVVRTE
jgi:hypothetical protein